MATYLIRRFFQTIVFIILASLLIYTALVMLMPDGPEYTYDKLKQDISFAERGGLPINTPEEGTFNPIKDLEEAYKLDRPWPINFFVWLFDPNDTIGKPSYDIQGNYYIPTKGIDVTIFGVRMRGSGILTGDFGVSTGFLSNVPVSEVLSTRWLNTLLLLATALALALVVGIPMGILSATRKGSRFDHAFTFFSLAGLSVPSYILGLLLIVFLAVFPKALHDQNGLTWLPWLPSGDAGDETFWSRVLHLVLPASTLAIPQIAWISRHTRFAMLDVLQQDYIRTAWAKGLGFGRVVFKHALRNSLIPVITQAALIIPALVSGATVVETVFAYEGMGRAFFRSLGGCLWADINHTREPPPCPGIGYFPIDYPLALTLLLIMVIVVAAANVVADILYAVADPRIKYGKEGEVA